MTVTVDYWADYLCAWCYLAQDRVAHLRKAHRLVAQWHPFELHPEIPPGGGSAPDVRTSKDSVDWLRSELRAAGLPYVRRKTWSNTRTALAASLATQGQKGWPKFHRDLYHSYWVKGWDIGDMDVIADIAQSAHVELPDVLPFDGVLRSRDAALELDIGATPGWKIGNAVFTGVHDQAAFDRVVARQA